MMQTMKLTRQLIKPDTKRKHNTAEGLLPGGDHVEVARPTPPPFLLSRKSLRFLGSAMGIAIAKRKSRCDFGVLRAWGVLPT